MLKLVFMGSDTFSLEVLSDLQKSEVFFLQALFTAPPRPQGRGYEMKRTCVHDYGEAHGIPVFTPETLRCSESVDLLSRLEPDLVVVASYGMILPEAILQVPRFGCINVHPSLLPRWRGASPVPFSLLAGDQDTGISIFVMDSGMDTGPLLGQYRCKMPPDITAGELLAFLADKVAELLIPLVLDYIEGSLLPKRQSDENVSLTRKLKKEDGYLDFAEESAQALLHRVQAMTPWPGAYFKHAQWRIQVLSATLSDKGFVCKDGRCFWPLVIKPAGKNVMLFEDFLRGHPEFKSAFYFEEI